MADYFEELARYIFKHAPNDEEREALPGKLWGAHHHSIPGKTGLFDPGLDPGTLSWLRPVMDEFQARWSKEHPEQEGSIDVRDSRQGGHIQSFAEQMSKVTREWLLERIKNKGKEKLS